MTSSSLPSDPALTQAAQPSTSAKKSFPALVWEWLACFRSIQLAIVLLSLLALGTLVGVLMPQEGLVDTVEIKRTYGSNYHLFKAMGLFNVYSSYWFITLEVLFFFNLLIGSFKWLKPAYMSATRQTFLAPKHITAAKDAGVMRSPYPQEKTVQQVTQQLQKRRYKVYRQDGEGHQALYATKGNFSRFGPVVAHFGILCMLIFSVMGAFTGFKAQKIAVPGDTFTLAQVNAFFPNVNRSVWMGQVPNWQFHVKDFRIEYYPDHPETPKQYFCTLDVLDAEGNLKATKTISVNDPLSVEDLTVYQASFTPTGKLFFELNGEPKMVEINTQFQDRPVSMTALDDKLSLLVFPFMVQQDPDVEKNYVMLFLHDGKGFVGAAPGKMPDNLKLFEGQQGRLGEYQLKFIQPEIATGLQIKKAPEVPGMYASFLIIILGTVLCVFSQRQLWVAIRPKASGEGQEVCFMYKTNKGRLSFTRELAGLEAALKAVWPPRLSLPEAATPSDTARKEEAVTP